MITCCHSFPLTLIILQRVAKLTHEEDKVHLSLNLKQMICLVVLSPTFLPRSDICLCNSKP